MRRFKPERLPGYQKKKKTAKGGKIGEGRNGTGFASKTTGQSEKADEMEKRVGADCTT